MIGWLWEFKKTKIKNKSKKHKLLKNVKYSAKQWKWLKKHESLHDEGNLKNTRTDNIVKKHRRITKTDT